MKKAFLFLVSILCCMCGCEKQSEPQQVEHQIVTFTVSNLDVTTRAELSDEELTDLYVFDNNITIEHQVSTDEDFGTIKLDLTYGQHNLSFVATKSQNPSYSNGVMSCEKLKPTYGYLLPLEVTSKTVSQSIVLSRLYGTVIPHILDEIPSNASTMDITMTTYCKNFNVSSFNGITDTYENSIDISGKIGKSNVSWNIYFLPPIYEESYMTNINIVIKDTDGNTIVSHSLSNITLKANQVSTIEGNYFGKGVDGGKITLNTTWDDEQNIPI